MLSSDYVVCVSKKLRFIKEQEGIRILRYLNECFKQNSNSRSYFTLGV